MQNSESIAEYLRRRKSQRDAEESAVDWDGRKREWLDDIKGLYDQIRGWLSEAEQEGLVKFCVGTVSIEEEYLGSYTAPSLSIDLGDQVVRLNPAFRLTLGAQGRVDMICGVKKAMLMRKGVGDWGIGTRESGSFRIISLDENSFSELLRGLTA